jgi:hypothetical protein
MSWTVAIGIDTHRDRHSACARDRRGRPLGEFELSADGAGYRLSGSGPARSASRPLRLRAPAATAPDSPAP